MRQIEVKPLDRTEVEEITLTAWEAAFNHLGRPGSLPAEYDYADVDTALRGTDDLTEQLLGLIGFLKEFASEGGRDALERGAREYGVDTTAVAHGAPEGDWPLYFFLETLRDEKTNQAFLMAQMIQEQRGPDRTRRGFPARDPGNQRGELAIGLMRARRAELRGALESEFAEHGLGQHVEIVEYDDSTHELELLVIRGERFKNQQVWEKGRRASLPMVPVGRDLIRYDGRRNWLIVTTGRPKLVEMYRRVVGEVVFEDPHHFEVSPILDLRKLAVRPDCIDPKPLETVIGSACLTLLKLRDGGTNVTLHSLTDCREHLNRIEGLEGCFVERSKIAVGFYHEGRWRRASAELTMPNIWKVPNVWERIIHSYLDKVGVFGIPPSEDERDLWAVPRAATEQQWRRFVGKSFDDLRAAGVLVEHVGTETAPHPDAEDVKLEVRQNPSASGLVGISTDGAFRDVSRLSPTDRTYYELQYHAFGRFLAGGVEFESTVATDGMDGVVPLGVVRFGDNARVALALITGDPEAKADAVATFLSGLAQGRSVAAIVPRRGRRLTVPTVAFEGWRSDPQLARRIIEETNIRDEMSALELARYMAPKALVVVDGRKSMIWVDNCEVDLGDPGSAGYKLFVTLARETHLTSEQVNKVLHGVDSTRRKVVSRLRQRLTDALAGRSDLDATTDLVKKFSGGLRMPTKAYVEPGAYAGVSFTV